MTATTIIGRSRWVAGRTDRADLQLAATKVAHAKFLILGGFVASWPAASADTVGRVSLAEYF